MAKLNDNYTEEEVGNCHKLLKIICFTSDLYDVVVDRMRMVAKTMEEVN